jgi:hypothetical protein
MQASAFSKEEANMTTSNNLAAWQLAAKGDIDVRDAPMYTVNEDEILIKVSLCAVPSVGLGQ